MRKCMENVIDITDIIQELGFTVKQYETGFSVRYRDRSYMIHSGEVNRESYFIPERSTLILCNEALIDELYLIFELR